MSKLQLTLLLTIPAVLGVTTSTLPALAAPPAPKSTKSKADNRPLTEDEKIIHVLNRLGFGQRPGDVERVKKMGLKNYIELQLHPEKIDDAAVEAKVASFDLLKATGMEVAEMEREVQMGNQRLTRLQSEMAKRGALDGSNAIQGAITNAQTGGTPQPAQQAQRAAAIYRNATPEERKELEESRMARAKVNQAGAQLVLNKLVRAVESDRQLYEEMVDFWSNHFNIDATKVRAAKVVDEQQVIRPHAMGKFRDLLYASANSGAMMIYLDNSLSVGAQTNPQRAGLRPGAARPLTQFTLAQLRAAAERGQPFPKQVLDRVEARAKAENITAEEAFKKIQTAQAGGGQAQKLGLNENYARELMELHTLGVDGGYTQKDVTEVARCLTGWGVKGGRYSGEFEFHPFLHDKGEKTVLGKTIPAGGGVEDGKMVLDMLASHPSTMRFISTKLCRRFVSDEPPASLVDKCVATWKRTDGDIPSIMATIINSPEFFSRAAYKAKIKSPFEFVVSAVRATGATVNPVSATQQPAPAGQPFAAAGRQAPVINVFYGAGNGQSNPRLLSGQIAILGEPLFNYGFPTGYPEDSSKWVSAGALIGRINFALSLVDGRIVDVDTSKTVMDETMLDGKPLATQVDTVAKTLLGTDLTPATRATLLKQLEADKDATKGTGVAVAETRKIASLLLGSPDFQRR